MAREPPLRGAERTVELPRTGRGERWVVAALRQRHLCVRVLRHVVAPALTSELPDLVIARRAAAHPSKLAVGSHRSVGVTPVVAEPSAARGLEQIRPPLVRRVDAVAPRRERDAPAGA